MATKKTGQKSNRRFLDMEATPGAGAALESAALPMDLGPLTHLPGHWRGRGTGWNMIALPFQGANPPYRVLMNQYDEDLDFTFVDAGVPNRGLLPRGETDDSDPDKFDQRAVTIDYQQVVKQTFAEDFPDSGIAGDPGLAIHHEPGLFLHMKNLQTNGVDIARLATIPHGNSVLALGRSKVVDGMPEIPGINGLPIGRFEEILGDAGDDEYDFRTDPYLEPYKHYIDNPFFGSVPTDIGFPGFNPANMNQILNFANQGVDVVKTTVLAMDTKVEDGGISNIPFVVREAEPVSMKSTFWIQELGGTDPDGNPRLRMQYSQVVMLNFFSPREDELPGRATWPHISINTLEKVFETEDRYEDLKLVKE